MAIMPYGQINVNKLAYGLVDTIAGRLFEGSRRGWLYDFPQ
jgi:hypothetical protein